VTEPREQARIWVVFTGLMLVMLLAALDSTIVATALPKIVDDLGGLKHIAWVTSAYVLAQTAAGATRASSAGSSAWRAWRGRCWAASSSSRRPGTGSSTSTSRSGWSRWSCSAWGWGS
jgi:MFS family permease